MVSTDNKIFSLPVLNWMLTVFMGGVIPVLLQNPIAVAIASLNPTPSADLNLTVYPVWLSVALLWGVFVGFIVSFSYLVFFVAKLKTQSSVWALIVFLIVPFTVWVGLPLLLGA